jgi:hypothetical protein
MKWLALLIVASLSGCMFVPPASPLPTPTTITLTSLPVEGILRGEFCNDLGTEYQVSLLSSEEEWNALLAQPLASYSIPDIYMAEVTAQMDFQNYYLLLALRTCHAHSSHTITIDRVVSVADRLYVYLELGDPAPGSYLDNRAEGDFHLIRVPRTAQSPDQPVLEVIAYQVRFIVGQPVP